MSEPRANAAEWFARRITRSGDASERPPMVIENVALALPAPARPRNRRGSEAKAAFGE
jgi:hypothetical protein